MLSCEISPQIKTFKCGYIILKQLDFSFRSQSFQFFLKLEYLFGPPFHNTSSWIIVRMVYVFVGVTVFL